MSGPIPRPPGAPDARQAGAVRPDPARRLQRPVPPKKARHGLYASAWALSGLVASAYVFALVIRQDGGGLIARVDRETDVMARTRADVGQLQRKVGQLETDMARVKIDQAQADEREKQIVQRVGSVENRVESFAQQIAATAATPTKQAKAAPEKQPAATLATGALPKPAEAPAPQRELAAARQAEAPAAAGEAAGILLARGPSLDALRLSWSLLNERYKGTLKTMEPRVVEVEPGTYQLVAGPVANPAEALKVCATLRARGVACQAADFRGSAL